MLTLNSRFKSILHLGLIFSFSSAFGQNQATPSIDLQKARLLVDSLDKEFAKHFNNGDSNAIYKMYAKDARFENAKGNEILFTWGELIRNSIMNDSRNLLLTTSSLSTDSEYIVELGNYEFKDSKGSTKQKGKFLVVWKQEDGVWKLYRDMGL